MDEKDLCIEMKSFCGHLKTELVEALKYVCKKETNRLLFDTFIVLRKVPTFSVKIKINTVILDKQ